MNSDYIVYALIAVGIFTAYMAVAHLFRRDRARDRVQAVAGIPHGLPMQDDKPSASAAFCEGLLTLFGVDVAQRKDLALYLARAGVRSPNAVAYYLFFKRVIQPVFLVLGGLLFLKIIISTGLPFMMKLLQLALALFLIIAGLFGANLYVSNRKQHRQQILLRSFPEILDLLLVCIESGLGLDAALQRVCAEMHRSHPEATYELDRTRVELTVLPDRAQALQNLAERIEIVPFRSLVAALIQTEKFGTSLLDTLRVLSEDQRSTRLLTAENRAARIPVLITIPLIFCILPSFIIIILGPPIIRVMEQGGIFGNAAPKSK